MTARALTVALAVPCSSVTDPMPAVVATLPHRRCRSLRVKRPADCFERCDGRPEQVAHDCTGRGEPSVRPTLRHGNVPFVCLERGLDLLLSRGSEINGVLAEDGPGERLKISGGDSVFGWLKHSEFVRQKHLGTERLRNLIRRLTHDSAGWCGWRARRWVTDLVWLHLLLIRPVWVRADQRELSRPLPQRIPVHEP